MTTDNDMPEGEVLSAALLSGIAISTAYGQTRRMPVSDKSTLMEFARRIKKIGPQVTPQQAREALEWWEQNHPNTVHRETIRTLLQQIAGRE